MKKSWFVGLVSIAFALTLTFAGLAAAAEDIRQKLTEESTIEQVIKRGVLRVGMSTFVPWAMQDKNGNLVGFEIDVAKKLGEDLGVKVEFVPTQWSGIIPALLTGKFDVIIGGMGIVPERTLKVNFTIPYDASGMSIVANKAKAPNFKSLEEFNKPDIIISTRMGSTAVPAIKRHFPKAQMRLFNDEVQAYQELRNGNVHATVTSAPRPAFEAAEYPDSLYLPIKGTFTSEPISFALRKGDPDTLNVFNSWITLQHATGFLADRHAYWFEGIEWRPQVQ